jgi:ankyrin repeat protein
MVDHLVKYGASVNHSDKRGKTALIRAALGGDGTTVDHLLKAGADVNQADTNGWTALICAAAGDLAIVKRLIDAGANTKHVAKDGMTCPQAPNRRRPHERGRPSLGSSTPHCSPERSGPAPCRPGVAGSQSTPPNGGQACLPNPSLWRSF